MRNKLQQLYSRAVQIHLPFCRGETYLSVIHSAFTVTFYLILADIDGYAGRFLQTNLESNEMYT